MMKLDSPRDLDIHTLADFVELLCLITVDRSCSRESIVDHVRDLGKKDSDYQLWTGDVLDDCFAQLEWRKEAFGDKYPFSIDCGGKVITGAEDLSADQKAYVFFLLCANLPFIDASYNLLTDPFERASYFAMKSIFPESAHVVAFGKNETDYTGAKWERLNQLAGHIGGEGMCDEGTFRGRDSGDGGIDLAAWLSLDDYERKNVPSALGQCACSRKNWSAKQSEISGDRLNECIHPSHPWMQLIFIPHCFRDNRGRWAVRGQLSRTIIFDRLRVIKAVSVEEHWEHIAPPELLDDFLGYRLDLV
ncbi:hypothetical protein [Halopseudomonas oceani]|uniref:hypothetical protein n=1 Tax=Halopseudomonas oceani TaxID=1708783 RepID=UPI002AA7AE67|nr:hypothetical protein [Halopseudomonas oceani]